MSPAPAPEMNDPSLVIQHLNKAYAAPVLIDVNLAVRRGEVHALVGENGAGKTTLVNILTGLTDKNSGDITLNGESYSPKRPADAFAAGVSFAAQELSIIGTLDVAENIRLRDLPRQRGVIDRSRLEARAREMLELVGLEGITADAEASTLTLAERQLLEIAKALADDPALLLLDEPTAALNASQAKRLHDIIRERANAGLSVIYISHRLHDVLEIADTVSVLRDGKVVASAPAAGFTADELVSLMAGGALAAAAATSRSEIGEALIRADAITTGNLPFPISLEGRAGEITGLAGLAGAGRSELLHALFGLDPLTGGTVTKRCHEKEKTIGNATEAVRAKIALVGEDRQSMGLFEGLSVRSNMMIPSDGMKRSLFRTIDTAGERSKTESLIDRVGVNCRSPEQDIGELSGGNQQKALIARWLNAGSDVFLLDEPTRGVDVGTKLALYERFRELSRKGACLIIASSETEELMAVCDRIIVLSDRQIAAELTREQFSEEAILSAAFSAFSQTAGATG